MAKNAKDVSTDEIEKIFDRGNLMEPFKIAKIQNNQELIKTLCKKFEARIQDDEMYSWYQDENEKICSRLIDSLQHAHCIKYFLKDQEWSDKVEKETREKAKAIENERKFIEGEIGIFKDFFPEEKERLINRIDLLESQGPDLDNESEFDFYTKLYENYKIYDPQRSFVSPVTYEEIIMNENGSKIDQPTTFMFLDKDKALNLFKRVKSAKEFGEYFQLCRQFMLDWDDKENAMKMYDKVKESTDLTSSSRYSSLLN